MTQDISKVIDRNETASMMEPLLISGSSTHRGPLSDLALELAAQSARLRRSLPKDVLHALADLVRSMNCYYSNLIEGHDTHPVDIERALKNDYSQDEKKRDLQLEAKAHIAVQAWIDEDGLKDSPTSTGPFWKSTAASAISCPKTCSGPTTRTPANGSKSSPANCANTMSKSAGTSRSAPALCRVL